MEIPDPNFNFNSPDYRYGYNGKEKDSEIKGEGNQYDYGFRVYDPRVARFLSMDPLFKTYAFYTPYQFAGNKPIVAVDLDGCEEKIVIHFYQHTGDKKPEIKTINYSDLGMAAEDGLDGSNTDYGSMGTGSLHVYNFASMPDADPVVYYEASLGDKFSNIQSWGSGSSGVSNKKYRKTESRFVDAAELVILSGPNKRSSPTGKYTTPGKKKASGEVGEGVGGMEDSQEPTTGSRLDKYVDKNGNKVVGVGVDENGDSTDIYRYDKPQHENGINGQHNYDRGSENWREGVRETENLTKDKPQ